MRNKKLIGFTNGCFDILHAGHVELLRMAKKQCDFLVVALNSDKSVRLLKGKNRPINNIKNRVKVIKCVRYVDKVIVFNDKDPLKIIKKIKPDIIFKGGDYKIKNIVGYDFQIRRKKKVKVIKLIKELSTTKLISKLLKNS